MSSSESEPKSKVPFDPGWNDPPQLSYSPQMQTNKPRNVLNKRVAFPLASTNTDGTQAAMLPTLPAAIASISTPLPQPMCINPISSPQLIGVASPSSDIIHRQPASEEFNSEQALSEVSKTLLRILEQGLNMDKSSADVKRRISMMEDSWRTGKLNTQAQMKMWKLTSALKEDQHKEADELHKALAVEHAGAVGSWLPAIRRLIHYAAARQDLLSIDKDESS